MRGRGGLHRDSEVDVLQGSEEEAHERRCSQSSWHFEGNYQTKFSCQFLVRIFVVLFFFFGSVLFLRILENRKGNWTFEFWQILENSMRVNSTTDIDMTF